MLHQLGQLSELEREAPCCKPIGQFKTAEQLLQRGWRQLVSFVRGRLQIRTQTTGERDGDAIDTVVETEDGPIVFVDTAGMRRRARIDDSAEYYSMVRALRAIDDADVALLVVDATEGVTGQDQRLAERVDASGCPVVILLNKWELIDDPETRREVEAGVGRKLAFLGEAPVLKISALSGRNVHKLRPLIQEAIAQYQTRVPTRDINKVLAAAQQRQPAGGGAKVLLKFMALLAETGITHWSRTD